VPSKALQQHQPERFSSPSNKSCDAVPDSAASIVELGLANRASPPVVMDHESRLSDRDANPLLTKYEA